MFIRLKFPVTIDSTETVNYIVLQDFQFSRTGQYDAYELSNIFSQETKLMMLLGHVITFTLSGTLHIKVAANGTYYADGLYNSSLGIFTFVSIPALIKYFNNFTEKWNDGKNNFKSDKFAIEYVNSHNENPPPAFENFLPESFTYSISNREVFVININVSGKIGKPITSSS